MKKHYISKNETAQNRNRKLKMKLKYCIVNM